eukprot:9158161-Ditylum_brightwellii.AAC.1
MMPQYDYPPTPYSYPQPFLNYNFQQQQHQRRKKFYCWMYGKDNHPGSLCHSKMTGHQDDAAFRIKKEAACADALEIVGRMRS